MTLAEVHGVLQQVSALLHGLRGNLPAEMSDDTALILGRALGNFDNASALLARDVQLLLRRRQPDDVRQGP
jgi:hypothetical protein